jgi:ArsR family transcriptional regulator
MRLVEIYRSLSDPTRLRILHLLSQRPLCVGHLQKLLQAAQVRVSKHLAYLRKRGLVEARRQGQMMVYRLPQPQPRELELQLQCLRDCVQAEPPFQEDLNRLEALRAECDRFAVAQPPPDRQPVSAPEPERPPLWPTEGLID